MVGVIIWVVLEFYAGFPVTKEIQNLLKFDKVTVTDLASPVCHQTHYIITLIITFALALQSITTTTITIYKPAVPAPVRHASRHRCCAPIRHKE